MGMPAAQRAIYLKIREQEFIYQVQGLIKYGMFIWYMWWRASAHAKPEILGSHDAPDPALQTSVDPRGFEGKIKVNFTLPLLLIGYNVYGLSNLQSTRCYS